MAAGFVSVPVVPTFRGMSKEFSERLEKPAKKSGEAAGKAISDGLGSSVENLERQVRASSSKLQDLDRAYEKSAAKQAAQKEKVEAATLKLQDAEEKYQNALESGDKGLAELAKVKEAKARLIGETEKLEQAEINTRVAEEKHKNQLDDLNATLGKLGDAQKENAHGAKESAGAMREAGDAADDAAAKSERLENWQLKAAAGFTALAGGAAVVGKALFDMGSQFDDAYDSIRVGTGASGQAFDDLKESMRNVATESIGVGSDMGAIGSTLADLNTRLGLTGEPLEKMTSQFLQLQNLGVDADINEVSKAMSGFGVEAKDMPGALDELFQISQATGLTITDLSKSAVKAGPALRGFGFSMADSAALVGQMDKAGLDADKTLQSMQRALAGFAAEGRDAPQALKETIGSIEDFIKAGDEAAAINMAAGIFGTRGATQFVDAVKTGTLSVEDFMGATGATSDTIADMAEETADFGERWDQFKAQVMVALEPVATELYKSLVPALDFAAEKFESLAKWVTDSLIPAFKDFGKWVQKNSDWLIPLGVALGTFAGSITAAVVAVKAWNGALSLYKKVTELATVETKLFNKALKTNVIFVVISAVAALVAGLTWFFTKTETGKKIWAQFMDVLKSGWDTVKQKMSDFFGWAKDLWDNAVQKFGEAREAMAPIIETVQEVARVIVEKVVGAFTWWAETAVSVFAAVWGKIFEFLGYIKDKFWPVIQTVFTKVGGLLSNFGDSLSWAWASIIRPVFQALADFATNVLWPGLQQVFTRIGDAWKALSDTFSSVWSWIRDSVLRPMVDFFKNTLWPAVQVVLGWIGEKWQWMSDRLSAVVNWIYDNVIMFYVNALKMLWDNVQQVISWIAEKWQWMSDRLSDVWNWIYQNVILRAIDGYKNLWQNFLDVVTWISEKWDWMSDRLHAGWVWINDRVFTPFKDGLTQLKSFFGTVVDGIRSVWDGLKSVLAKPINFMINTVYNDGIAKAWDTIAGFLPLEPKTAKRLSPIGGYATGGAIRGKGTGTSDDILAWLSNGEHVWTAQDVRDIGGQSAMYAMRDALKHGRGFTFDGKNLALLPRVDSRVGDLAGAAPGLFPQGAFKEGGEVRPMWELQLEKGHLWAKSRHGRPYVLGGSADGGGGTDCSGFMSGIADVMGGGSGARQWATMSFNGGGNSQYPAGPQGFVAGLKGNTFSIGVTNGGAAGGHTAGTLGATSRFGAVNVESGGSPSLVKYGVGAAGANDSYFTTHYHLPIGPGGAFEIGKGSGGPSPDMMRAYVSNKVEGAIDKIMGPIAARLPSGPPSWKEIPRGVYDKGKKSMADKTADIVANLGDRLSTVFTAAKEVGDIVRDGARGVMELAGRAIGIHDSGGWLQNGNLALNLSGKPEPVLTNAQWASVSEMVKSIGDLVPAIKKQTEAIAQATDSAQNWFMKVGDYNSVEGINARQGVRRLLDLGLDLPGTEVITQVLDAEDTLWDSRARAIGHVQNLADKEKALQEARQAAAELANRPAGVSADDQKKIDDAQKALDEAKAEKAKADSDDARAKAADKVTEAEEKLKQVREGVDKNSEENAQKHAEEVIKANDAVAKAEQELVAARKQQAMDLDNIVLVSQAQVSGLLPMVEKFADQLVTLGVPAAAVGAGLAPLTGGLSAMAAFIGPAGITLGMALDLLKAGIAIIKKIVAAVKEIIEKVRKARLDALKALADGWAVIADYAKLTMELETNAAKLQQALVRGANAQREAEYNLMLAQHDRYIAEAEGALKVAEARLALDAEIKRGATIAQLKLMGLHEDWDSYLAYQAMKSQGVLEEWSDAAISALYTYEKARAEALKGEVTARLEHIKAEAALAAAARQNLRNQQDLLAAQERLIRMSAKVAGVDLVEATGTAQVAKLMSEMAQLTQAMNKNTLGKWGARLGAQGSFANEYRGQKAKLEGLREALDAVVKETGVTIDRGELDRTLKLMARAAYRGGTPMDVLRARMPQLADAETALRVNEALKPIYDARDQKKQLERQVEDFKSEMDLYEKSNPLERTIKGLEYTIKSLEQSAGAFAKGNEGVRGEYLRAAQANSDAAAAAGVDWKLDKKYANQGVRDQIRRETTIHLDGEKMYTADQIDQLLAEVTAGTSAGYRMVRSASEVATARRKERV
ncbi:hypothetical protein GWO64_009365 [Corynebacterium macginleyi]|uniref:phage tail tape measure protein n=1 Tax=Corynebacterium macginleyi TaxID=38290 RepID=UPI00190A70A0|nr:phage tail tape measure protein [Corynebacterium macginleyi]QRJ57454.1 hypothetical protein GWO64_009365 [Corynebacterium macginleyi]